jgi:hypothetical protein
MSIEGRLLQLVAREIAEARGGPSAELTRATVLAHTGLDSLGFASVVVAMSKEFGLDPFGGSDDIVYPETFGELLGLYEAEQARTKASP